MGLKSESGLMKFFRALGRDNLAWPLRRLYCPVARDALVLEIGSGGNPYYRANVLCDSIIGDTAQRFSQKLVVDRPMVISSGEKLPFKDGVFDFVIASHVLEHSKDPVKFISEMQRVGRAGYVEVPDAFMERLTNYPFHMLEITDRDGKLIIRKKTGPIEDREVWDLFREKARSVFKHLPERYPFNFHVRYYWSADSGGIKYEIVNPDYVFDWEPEELPPGRNRESFSSRIKHAGAFAARKFFSQGSRNKKIDLEKYLMCVACGGEIKFGTDKCRCDACGHNFQMINGKIPDFI